MSLVLDKPKGSTLLLQHFLHFYTKRRKLITRSGFLLILYLIFNSSSTSSKKRSQRRNIVTTSSYSAPECKSKNPFVRILHKLKHSPTVLLISQLSFKDRKNTARICGYLASQLALIVAKAFLTLEVATLDGALVSTIVSKEFRKFFKYLVFWMAIGIPSSIVSSLIVRTQGLLCESIRVSLTQALLEDYLPDSGNSTIYQLVNQTRAVVGEQKEEKAGGELQVKGDSSITSNPNQIITTTVDQLSDSMSVLPFQLFDPVMDIMLAANRLNEVSDYAAEGTLMLGLVANVSTLLLKIFTPNFSSLSSIHHALENKFHTYHAQVVDHREEIALSRGHRRELDMLDTTYFESERFQRLELRRMAVYNFAVGFIFKYGLGAFGLMLCSIPVFTTAYLANFKMDRRIVSKLSADFFANRRLLMSASDSLGRLIQSKKSLQNTFGYSRSVWEFDSILRDINDASKNVQENENDRLIVGPNVSYGDEISFKHVPLVTPSGNVLVEDLNFSIHPGENLLVIGPNGCGKSSLFRILGGLWEVRDPGHVTVPPSRRDLFYLPQRSYLTYGSLREQIIYPDSLDDYREKLVAAKKALGTVVKDDDYLTNLLHMVHLEHLLGQPDAKEDTDGSDGSDETVDIEQPLLGSALDVVKKWPDLLSGGEQQRLAMARLYYHQPKFAVLDECTSAISPDLEKECYRIATEDFGITVLSVCHRTSLWQFHSYILKFTRTGDQSTTLFTKFDPQKRIRRHEELIEVEAALKKDEDLQTRLESLKRSRRRKKGRGKLMYIGD
ncbi:DEKNAAC102908 [Brettanomyces naardenensis]|uniref:DEKNAAC102908 n=1 Tax=Brettanomyces naardenensis TaxID=13370 RepID=A0A448YM43_BRENA|nr:DEKNAAC102908 [Brettanomyces naardenensis]